MARTKTNDPLQKYQFRVTIPGLPTGMGFNKVSGLSREIGVVEYDEGGYAHTHKMPGKQKTAEVTFEKGMFTGKELELIYQKTLSDPNFRTTVQVEQLDKAGAVARSWTLAEAWVSKWEGTDFDATSEDVAIEKITMQHEYFLD